MTWRILYFLACVALLAAITHILVVLLIPEFGTKDAYAIVAKQTELLDFKRIDADAPNSPLTDIDPFFAYGVCRFDLTEDGMMMRGETIDTFWSATVVDGDGTVIYSLNSRTAIDNRLDLILLNPVQILRLREMQPPELESAIVVEADIDVGFAVLRVLRPDPSWNSKTAAFLDKISCESYSPEAAPGAETDEEPAS